ncbi:MAG: outer membrane protein assembly factor BamB family protein, partial [Planctomycetota bacterium]
ELLWQFDPKMRAPYPAPTPTAPVAAGGLIFTGGPDGIVRALDAGGGKLRWKAYTGGAVRIPPAIWNGRAFVGSGDGNALSSTWPAAAGVLVEDGVAYVAAGIVNYDGTYVYALDAVTGRVKWHNDTSGHLNPDARSGVSVQGHMLLHDGKLYLAGGNAVSPAIYDTKDGKCLNDPNQVQTLTQNNVLLTQSPRGWELSLLADRVVACGRPFYAHPDYDVYDPTVFGRVFLTSGSGRDITWVSSQNNKRVLCFDKIDKSALSRSMENPRNRFLIDWTKLGIRDKPLWSHGCNTSVAVAVCGNAVVIAEESKIAALNVNDGSELWSHKLPAAPVEWGLAIDSKGRAVVTLEDGRILCFGEGGHI